MALNGKINNTTFTDATPLGNKTETAVKNIHISQIRTAIDSLQGYSANVENCGYTNCCESCQDSCTCQSCQTNKCQGCQRCQHQCSCQSCQHCDCCGDSSGCGGEGG